MTTSAPTQQVDGTPYAGFGWRSAWPLISAHLPTCLVGDEQKGTLSSFAQGLPGSWYWGMFEVRLGPDDSRADLLAALIQSPRTRQEMRMIFSSGGHAALDSARGTLEAWSKNDDSHFARSPNLWFEWDHDRPTAPALHWICLAPRFFDRSQGELEAHQIVSLTEQFMETAPDLRVAGASETLGRLARSLPDGGRLMSFSSLKPRGRNACRVFASIPRGKLAPWLNEIGWRGNFDQLAEALPHFEVDGEPHFCQLEFGEDVGPYLGLELAQTERGFPRKDARQKWFRYATQQGFASEEKANAVLNWHGADTAELPNSPPVKLLRSFHLKLALLPERPPEAKAYLGFYFRKAKRALAA